MHFCVAKFLLFLTSIIALTCCTPWFESDKTNKLNKEIVDVVEVLLDQDPN